MELAHANRVTTMGQLTASIAHEVNQPIAAMVTNAAGRLALAGAQPPDLEEVRQALDRIAKDGMRAGDVIGRIRALVKKAPPRKDRLDINEAILEVIALTRGEAAQERRLAADAARGRLAAHSGRSGPAATGDPQPDHQRRRGDERGRRGVARVADHHRDRTHRTACSSRCGIRARDWSRRASTASSTHSTRPSRRHGHGTVDLPFDHRGAWRTLWASANVPRGAIFQFTLPLNQMRPFPPSTPVRHTGRIEAARPRLRDGRSRCAPFLGRDGEYPRPE